MAGLDQLLLELRNADHDLYPVATDEDIALTEEGIGVSLPDSFKSFVRVFINGAFLYRLQEVSAVGQGSPQIAPIQSIEPIPIAEPDSTIPFREGGETKFRHTVPFGLDHNGNEWCFVTEGNIEGHEYPVAYLSSGCEGNLTLYSRLGGFREWLEVLVGSQDEVIRVVYRDDEDVLYDELCLG